MAGWAQVHIVDVTPMSRADRLAGKSGIHDVTLPVDVTKDNAVILYVLTWSLAVLTPLCTTVLTSAPAHCITRTS